MGKWQCGKTLRILLIITAALVFGILAAISIPAFVGREAKLKEKAAMQGLRNLLTAAVASSVADSKSPPTDAIAAPASRQHPAASISPREICDGVAVKALIPNGGFIRESFEFPCPEKIVIYMGVTSTTTFGASAHTNGSCIWIGNSISGLARLNAACGENAPDWTGSLQDSALLAALDKARNLRGPP